MIGLVLFVRKRAPRGGQVLLDARATDYIDPDVLDLLRDFAKQTAPAHGVRVSLLGFRSKYQLHDQIEYVDYSTRELQNALTPQQVLQLLRDGHERFRTGRRLTRDLGRQVNATAEGQHPLAVVLSCIDSRAPTELIFDLGLGDILSVRIAGNVISHEVLGSLEYACAVAGAKLILVMGHTRCGAVSAALELAGSGDNVAQATGCQHLEPIIRVIQQSIDPLACQRMGRMSASEKADFADEVSRKNVAYVAAMILTQSRRLASLAEEGQIAIRGAVYDVASGQIQFASHAEEAASDAVEPPAQGGTSIERYPVIEGPAARRPPH